MPQEPDHAVKGEVSEREPGDLAALVGREERKEEPDRVPVAAHRGRTEALHGDQVVGEERLQDRPDRSFGHRATSARYTSADASKRRLASVSSCGGTVS